jgi:hypothetical protein
MGRMYISRDILLNEAVFLFSSLHSNAGACLRDEINLLPLSYNLLIYIIMRGLNCENQLMLILLMMLILLLSLFCRIQIIFFNPMMNLEIMRVLVLIPLTEQVLELHHIPPQDRLLLWLTATCCCARVPDSAMGPALDSNILLRGSVARRDLAPTPSGPKVLYQILGCRP